MHQLRLRPAHWTRRFFGSLWPLRPKADDVEWAFGFLSVRERALFQKMSNADKRHALHVAKEAQRLLGSDATRPVMAAALMHDVGKTVAGLGTYGRVVATLSSALAGDEYARDWQRSTGLTRRVGLYLQYPQFGADLLSMAGSDELAVAWAREHHMAPEEWTVPREIGDALTAADR